MNEKQHILNLARSIKDAVESGDRQPPATITEMGRDWIIEGLLLLAERK